MADIKISVIMPVYKVEAYVARAIESIINQTLKEIEILIVDDGTPDNSGKICDEYAKKDSRIKVFHKENGGAPSARNAAMDIAKGKYLYFMDSDDWATEDMLKKMYERAEKSNAELIVAGYFIDTYYDKEHHISEEIFVDDRDYQQTDFRENAYRYFDRNMLYTPWNKLYLRQYVMDNDIYFPDTLWDDFPFNLRVIREIKRVSVMEDRFYHFIRARAESETASYQPLMYKKRQEEHGWMKELYKSWGMEAEPKSLEMISRRYVERFIGCVENLTNPKCEMNRREIFAEMDTMLHNSYLEEALQYACPKSQYMKWMLLPVRWKNRYLLYWEGKLISFVKTKNKKLFAVLKAGR